MVQLILLKNNIWNHRFKADDRYDEDEYDGYDKCKGKKKSPQGKHDSYITIIPNFLYNSLDSYPKNNLTNWRELVNQGGHHGTEGCSFTKLW